MTIITAEHDEILKCTALLLSGGHHAALYEIEEEINCRS